MAALGFPTFRYRLTAFVMAGAMGGAGGRVAGEPAAVPVAGDHALDAVGRDHDDGDPWRHGHAFGPVAGAAAYLLLENVLSGMTSHWQAILGPLLVLVVLFRRRAGFWAEAGMPDVLLATRGLLKRFGGLVATNVSPWRSVRAKSMP